MPLAAVDPMAAVAIVGSEQFLQHDATHLVHRVPHGHLGCLEINGGSMRAAPRYNA